MLSMKFRQQVAAVMVVAAFAVSSSAQSLGEVARRERANKQARPSARRILTEDDLREGSSAGKATATASVEASEPVEPKPTLSSKDEKLSPAELQGRIKAQKQKVRELEAKIDELQKQLDARNTIGTVSVAQHVLVQPGGIGHNAGVCASLAAVHSHPYKEWCDQPAKLAAEIEQAEVKLREEQAVLEALQEEARRLGFGSAFYDPD
jgi:hypothetical protein